MLRWERKIRDGEGRGREEEGETEADLETNSSKSHWEKRIIGALPASMLKAWGPV